MQPFSILVLLLAVINHHFKFPQLLIRRKFASVTWVTFHYFIDSLFFSHLPEGELMQMAEGKNQYHYLHVATALKTMLSALDKQFPAERSGFLLGETCARYCTDTAEIEGLYRAVLGILLCWRAVKRCR
ncbi:hypothetical protein [Kosakonia sp. S42]|uniref:hypothetical protein n=1 Tax=Kosakonia sp. S42 TaxID=2767458 RepID=UPI00190C2FCC|nr:hypothetical protein [Kosakonia sp. S42]MBK0019515.1 hypothetical protein [Kosakonia sp. S42]